MALGRTATQAIKVLRRSRPLAQCISSLQQMLEGIIR